MIERIIIPDIETPTKRSWHILTNLGPTSPIKSKTPRASSVKPILGNHLTNNSLNAYPAVARRPLSRDLFEGLKVIWRAAQNKSISLCNQGVCGLRAV